MKEVTGSPRSPSASHFYALEIGHRLHEFEIRDVLGHGGFGITYLAFDSMLQERVAIKEYLPNDLAVRVSDATIRAKSTNDIDAFENGRKSFIEEARIVARLRHPNIVQVRRFFEHNGTGYIVQDYVEGETLSQRIDDGPLPEPMLQKVLNGVLDGLEVAHGAAILHRDLKPNNIILRPSGVPVLIDFGAARDFTSRHSRSVTAIAAPGYSPPEQYGIGGQQGPWTDFYAVGAIAYRCVTGSAPPDSLRRLRNDPLVPLSTAAAGRYKPALLLTIDWMLALDEDNRPPSVRAIRDRLNSSAELVTTVAGNRNQGLSSPPDLPAAPTARSQLPVRSLAAALALMILVGAGFGFWRHQQTIAEEFRRNTEQLEAAGFDRQSLERFVRTCGDRCAELHATARQRLDVLGAEQQTYQNARGDQSKLQAYAKSCKACEFATAAESEAARIARAELERLANRLAEAGLNEAALNRVAAECGSACPENFQDEVAARRRTLRNEAADFRGAANNLERLRDYLRDCRGCQFREEAKAAVSKIEEDNRQADYRRQARALEEAGTDRAALERFISNCASGCSGDLLKEARARLDNFDREQINFTSARNNPESLRSYLAECRICSFRAQAEGDLVQIEKARQAEERQLFVQLDAAGTDRATIERLIAGCGVGCPAGFVPRARERLAASTRQAEARTQEDGLYREARGSLAKLRHYTTTCSFCENSTAASKEIADLELQENRQRQQRVATDERAFAQARGSIALLESYVANCQECGSRSAAQAEIVLLRQQDADRLRRDQDAFGAARGNIASLEAYLANCRDCANRSAAQTEITSLRERDADRTRRDTEAYSAARGNAANLQAYLANCQVCGQAGAARNELDELRRTTLANGNYPAERGYSGPMSRSDPINCPPSAGFTVTVTDSRLNFEVTEKNAGGSYVRRWTGRIEQPSGTVRFNGADAEPRTRQNLMIEGPFDNARIASDYCGPGYFRISRRSN